MVKIYGDTKHQSAGYYICSENNYVMQSGQGVTQLITRVLFQTIDTILLNPGKIDELIVILDSEEYNEQERKKQVENIIKEYIDKKNCAVDFFI